MLGKRNCRRGFSLIEAAIVLAILGIIATFTIANIYSSIPHAQLETAQLRVAEIMMLARNQSRSEEVNTRVLINSVDGTFWIEAQDRETLAWSNAMPGGGVENLPERVAFQNVTFAGNIVNYTTRGTLLTGGTITLVADNGQTIDLSGNITTGRFSRAGGNLR